MMNAEPATLKKFINPDVLQSVGELAESFNKAQPFRYLVMDDFLDRNFCEAICAQFPEFKDAHAMNENKQVGLKATREKVRTLGPAFRNMDDLIRQPEFLELVGKISGIDDLHYDPYYFGGGTHENREGQDLDPHIDFNFHPITRQHRRLNLIIYLNESWQEDWGGSLQLHRDPYREPSDDEIVTVSPLRNRCVIFETTEHSWHGFERIDLPDDERNRSRKSFAVYYYTDIRPEDEAGDEHSTVYVERHLPERIKTGLQLGTDDVNEIKRLLTRRDQHLKRLYRNIRDLHGRVNAISHDGAEAADSESRPEQVSNDLNSASRMIKVLRHRVDELESSTSWRITAPIRAVKRLFSGHS
jgi:hypothetical protein